MIEVVSFGGTNDEIVAAIVARDDLPESVAEVVALSLKSLPALTARVAFQLERIGASVSVVNLSIDLDHVAVPAADAPVLSTTPVPAQPIATDSGDTVAPAAAGR